MTIPHAPLSPVVLSDPEGVADDLVVAVPGDVHVLRTQPAPATVERLHAWVVHVVVPDDGSDAPIEPAPEPSDAYRAAVHAAGELAGIVRIVILDGCYQPELADRLTRSGTAVLGLPGRLGRERVTAFASAWYQAAATAPPQDAFDQAMTITGLHHLPNLLQPRWHDVDQAEPAVFRGPAGAQSPEVTVWYGTNRHPSGGSEWYCAEPDDDLHLGRCTVRVPLSVPVGQLRSRRFRSAGQAIRYLITRHDLLDDLTPLRSELDTMPVGTRSVLVYVHGFRVRFAEAVTRAAQLHSDLKYPGQTAVFSWPSQGTMDGYLADEEAVQHAERYLLRFLAQLHGDARPERIDVLAHSMGNRAMLRVAMRVADGVPDSAGLRFGNVILAAADVGHRFFRTEAAVYPRISDGVTAYVSAGDKALKSSRVVHRVSRAGLTPPLTLVDGIDTIEATDLDLDLLGHGYYAQAREVLGDINAVVYGRHDPQSRIGLAPAVDDTSRKPYWRFRA